VITDRAFAEKLAAAGHQRVLATNYDAMVASFKVAIDHAATTHRARPRSAGLAR